MLFWSTPALCPPLGERLRAASLASDVEATGNCSYACERSCGGNFLMVGDAYAFIDPVFSTGVMLSMHSGATAAETADICRRTPARKARALQRFDRPMRLRPKPLSGLIYRPTNPTPPA